tara:strand:+ start:118 stop:339 length:222 start_codon:yes stop_codon:yes gene_type:complete
MDVVEACIGRVLVPVVAAVLWSLSKSIDGEWLDFNNERRIHGNSPSTLEKVLNTALLATVCECAAIARISVSS